MLNKQAGLTDLGQQAHAASLQTKVQKSLEQLGKRAASSGDRAQPRDASEKSKGDAIADVATNQGKSHK